MKKVNLLYAILALFVFASCDDFLDKIPDDRATVDNPQKIKDILVSAYPSNTDVVMTEMASDNAMDNGANFTIEDRVQEESYLWADITQTSNDSPKSYWDACYLAIAAANQALDAINEYPDQDAVKAQRGEALMCRAYGHFALANTFCLSYNPETADTDLGMPYSSAPETQVSPQYTRGTMAELYEKINADIEAALPLIDDNLYSVPKYHFNRKAAYAFAARFNLYYQNYDKVIEYANVVLGSDPTKMMRNWGSIALSASDWQLRCDAYINASEPANLLMCTAYSSWGYWGGPYNLGRRYGNARPIITNESVRSTGLWGAYANLLLARSMWGYDEKLVVTKIGGYFNYTDRVNGIGYRMNVYVLFSADETLLCRAEAYALKNDLASATKDINYWLYTHTWQGGTFNAANVAKGGIQVTQQDIVNFYSALEYTPIDNSLRTQKKVINPRGFTVSEGDQENIIQCILHLRRIETVHEGMRWQDIKRYGIEISHNRAGTSADNLLKDDPRRAIQLPADVIDAGLEPNPRNK